MVTYPSDFIGPLRPGDTRASAPPTVKDPKTGREWGSPEEYVKDPKKYGGGGGGGNSRSFKKEFARRQAAKKAKAAAQAKAAAAAKARLNEAQVQQEYRRILDARARIISRGGRESIQNSTDWKTKDKLKITSWKVRGDKVVKVENLDKGTVKYQSYAVPRGGGSTRFTGGVTVATSPIDKNLGKPLVPTKRKGKFIGPLRQFGLKSEEDLGRRLKGLEEISSFTRREGEKAVEKVASGQPISFKERAILLGIQFAIPSQELILGLKQLPAFAKSLINNPNNIIKVPGQIFSSLKESGLEIVALAKVHPGLAAARIGGEIITLRFISGGFKVIGKVIGTAAKKIAPALKPIRGGTLVAKSATRKGVVKLKVFARKSKTVRKIGTIRKATKIIQEKEIGKFKSAVEYSKQLKGARVARKTARKKGFTVNIGDTNYIEAIAKVEQTAKNLGFNKAKIIIRRFENSGGKLGLGKAEEFIRIVQRFTVKELKKLPEYKKLVLAAKLNKPYQLKFLKIGKIQKARIIFNNVKIKVSNLPIIKKINKIFNKIKKSSGFEYLRKATREFKKLKSMSNKAINAEIKKFKLAVKRKKILTKLQKARLADLKQARKIRKIARRKILNKGKNKVTLAKQAKKSRLLDLKQARKIRKLSRQKQLAKRKKLIKAKLKPKKLKSLASSKETSRRLTKKTRIKILERKTYRNIKIQDIDKVNNYRNVNKVVDNLFDEVFRRQKISLAPVKYRMLKNNVKKKLIKAIKNGDKAQVNKFKAAAKKMIRDMDKPISQPSVKIVKKGSKSFRTIKDFKPEVPKGRYVEVRQGQQVMLQKVKQIQKAKSVKKIKPQLFVIQSVQKKTINLLPILRFASEVIASQSIKQLFKLKTKTTSKTISKTKQISTQGSKPLEKTAQDSISKLDVTQAVAQDVKSKLKPSIKQKKKLIREKKKQLLIPKIRERFKSKKLSSEIPTYYVVEKVRGKFKKLFPKPLTQKDARDYAVWSIDNHLSKTAFLVPMGGAKQIVRPPKNIAGYYSKHRIKVRKYKIRYGKKKQMLNGFIEKRKYFQDQPLEKAQMKRLRRKARRKSPKRTAPPKKKKVKMSASRRKQMLSNLKKARSKLKRIRYKK